MEVRQSHCVSTPFCFPEVRSSSVVEEARDDNNIDDHARLRAESTGAAGKAFGENELHEPFLMSEISNLAESCLYSSKSETYFTSIFHSSKFVPNCARTVDRTAPRGQMPAFSRPPSIQRLRR